MIRLKLRSPTSSLILLLTLAPTVAAQQPRGRVRGRVIDRAGESATNARVTLVSRPLAGYERAGQPDEVTTETGERGAFQVKLLSGRTYSAWAIWKDADGRHHVTTIMDDVRIGSPVRLQETAKDQHFGTRTLRGLDAWKLAAPKAFIRLESRVGWHVPAELRDGKIVLPPIPVGPKNRATLEIRDGKENVILTRSLDLTRKPNRITLASPLELEIRVQADGKPIQGATIATEIQTRRWSILGSTNADGSAVVRIPTYGKSLPDSLRLCASREGYADGYAGWSWRDGFANHKLTGKRPKTIAELKPIEIELQSPKPFQGRVLGPDGKPAAGVPVVIGCSYRIAKSPTSSTSFQMCDLVVETDAKGTFAIERMPREVRSLCAAVVLPVELHAAMAGAKDGWPMPPRAMRVPAQHDKPLRIQLADYCPLFVQLTTSDGRPARGAEVYAANGFGVDPSSRFHERVDTDKRGRATVFVKKHNPLKALFGKGLKSWIYAWSADAGYAFDEVRASKPGEWKKTCNDFDRFRGKVVDKNGKPVPGARIGVSGYGYAGSWPFHSITGLINGKMIRSESADDGTFDIRFIAHKERRQHVHFSITRDKKRHTTEYQLTEAVSDVEIVFENLGG